MRFCLQSFLLWIKQQIRSPKSWIFMLLLPAVVFAAVLLLPEEENSAPVQVGVCLPDTGGEDFWELLTDRSEAVITFCLADEETICAKVATGQWDCGIVLAPDFARSVTRADTDEMIVLYTSTASVVYPLVQEAVSAVVMQMVSPEIASGYAQKIGIGDLESIKKLADSQRVAIQMRSLSGAPLQVQTLTQKSTETLLLGCVALVLLIWCVFCAIDLGNWRQSNQALRMCMIRSPMAVLMPRAAAALTPALLAGLASVYILDISANGIIALLGYLICLWAVALLLSGWQAILNALPVLMPFVAVLGAILSPVILDIGIYFPQMAPVCNLLPISLLLRSVQGEATHCLILWMEAILLLALYLLSEMKNKKVR